MRLFHVVTICSLFLIAACASKGGVLDKDSYDFIDKNGELNRDDYRNITEPRKLKKDEIVFEKAPSVNVPPVPDMAQILAAPKPPKIGKTKLVSVSVTDDVPLKDVLIELARLADVDIELGNGIDGGVSFRAKDKPFSEVIERISDLAGLRYSVKNGVLRIEQDSPYLKNYSIDFLNIIRDSESTVNVATDVLSSGDSSSGSSGGSSGGSESGGGTGVSTGTSSSITSTTASDLWAAMQANITEILNYETANKLTQFGEEDSAQLQAQVQAAAGVAGAAGAEGAVASSGRGIAGTFFVMNRQAGVLSVAATERQHAMLEQYLEKLERSATAQVLIEAKIIEVTLKDEYQSGVDWTAAIGNTDFGIAFPATIQGGATTLSLQGDNNLGINLDSVVQLVERFGTSKTLSSPRLHAINNQQAVLTFAENRVFFEVQIEQQDAQVSTGTTIPGTTSITSTRRSIPIGIIMSILPSIDLNKNSVTLNVRPTLSRQVDTVQDPGSVFLAGQLENGANFINNVPVVEVRELDSVMKLKSGSVMVIGGLMQDSDTNDDEGVPGVSDVPWLGNAFKSVDKKNFKRELIILIKATIVNQNGAVEEADKNVYQKFFKDPRPLEF